MSDEFDVWEFSDIPEDEMDFEDIPDGFCCDSCGTYFLGNPDVHYSGDSSDSGLRLKCPDCKKIENE